MVRSLLNPFFIDLQLFSEGGAEGTGANGADAASHTGGTSPDAGVNAAQKTYTDDEVQNIIKGRVRSLEEKLSAAEERASKYENASPLYESLAKKYGVSDASDIGAIQKAVEADDSYLEDEALERGMSIDSLRHLKQTERRASAMEKELNEIKAKQQTEQQTRVWLEQAEQTKTKYADFDLKKEMQNPEFANYLKAGIPMQKAYEAIHMDELLTHAMHTAASAARNDVTADIMARGRRPGENGLNSQSAADVRTEVNNLSSTQIRDFMTRAERGEKIKF